MTYHEIRVAKIPSVNHYVKHAKGRHYKSKEVIDFEKVVYLQLAITPIDYDSIGKQKKFSVEIIFCLNKNFYKRDLDNMLKAFIDCLAKFYKFNDSRICNLQIAKVLDKSLKQEIIKWRFV